MKRADRFELPRDPPAPPPGDAARLSDLAPDQRRAVRRSMRVSVAEGSLTQVFLNWTSGSVLIGFMLHLGASPAEIALVGSVPLLAQVGSPAAAYLAASLGRRKALTVAMALTSRLAWLAAASLPMVPMPDAWRPSVLIVVVLIASVFLAANSTLWTAWMGDVVPERERGRYFGLRAGVVGVVGTAANLAAGAFLDRVGAPFSFQAVLVASVAIALIGVSLYLVQLDPPTAAARVRWRDVVTLPWRDAGFRRFLVFALYWHFVVLLAAPFVFPYFLGELRLSFTQVAVWSTIAALTSLGTAVAWGRVADRAGNRAVLAIGTLLVLLLLPLARRVGSRRHVWIAIFGVALVEPVFQVAFAGGHLTRLDAYTAVHVFGFALAQLYRFRRYDFASMLVMRLVYYLYWHILWGWSRLAMLG